MTWLQTRVVPLMMLSACFSEGVLESNVCNVERLGQLDGNEVGLVGVSPNDAVAQVAGTVLTVVMAPAAGTALSPEDSFESTLTVQLSPRGDAFEEQFSGALVPGDANVQCPTGPMLTVPVSATVELGVGGRAVGEGALMVSRDEPSGVWLGTGVLPVEDPPPWLQDIANAEGCSIVPAATTLGLVFGGHYLSPESAWVGPKGDLEARSHDAASNCAKVLFEWSTQGTSG